MSVLTVSLASVKLLCGYTDSSQDTGITALIALQQPALEYALDPAVLAYTSVDAGLLALLTLGVTEIIAGGYIATLGRGLVSTGLQTAQTLNTSVNTLIGDNTTGTTFQQQTFKIGSLEVSTRPLFDNFRPEVTRADLVKLGQDLAAAGLARLTPFLRSSKSLARAAVGGDQNLDDQANVPLLIGAGLGAPGPVLSSQGPPADPNFDAVLGTDGQTDPPSGDIYPSPFLGFNNPSLGGA